MPRRRRYDSEKRYYQFTGCPSVCECGRSCGWTPTGRTTDPVMVRLGVTSGRMRQRLTGYERDADADYFDHVGVIGVRHLHPSVPRSANLVGEAAEIERYRPPFNQQHNPERGTATQAAKQAAIMGRPVPWLTRAEMKAERLRSVLDRGLQLCAAAAVGSIVTVCVLVAAGGL